MKKRYKRQLGCVIVLIVFVAAIFFCFGRYSLKKDKPATASENSSCAQADTLENFAKDHNLNLSDYPDELVNLLNKNPETKDFVYNYPLKRNSNPKIDLSNYENSKSAPLLMQWDERWGYDTYSGELMGISGCGPTCLSMVCIYLLKDATFTPKYVAEFAENNGYSVFNNGSKWTLISEGGKELGLNVTEIPLDENRIMRNLKAKNPIVCIMGKGDFTSTGHFIVMTDYVDGKVKVNDPNSKARSEKLWDLAKIKGQIRNLWVCQK